jgi:hypothetical protein
MSYTAIITKLQNVRSHSNADRLKLGNAQGNQVVVGLNSMEGALGIYFPTDGQLSEQYASANDLIGYVDPETKERKGGFFAKNRRVRTQKFRGEKSDGYFAPLESLAFTGINLSSLKDGISFTELNSIPICNKYVTPATARMLVNKNPRKQNQFFNKHIDTEQFKHRGFYIPRGALLSFTCKQHGTSGRFGYVLDEKTVPNPLWKRFLLPLSKPKTALEFDYLHGSRNVIFNKWVEDSYYGDEGFRWKAIEHLRGLLHKGEILYYELVGFTNTGTPIMPEVSTKILKDKSIESRYGSVMRYKYGCNAEDTSNQTRLFVYRITRVSNDGNVIDLSWDQVKARCRGLGVTHVPELHESFVYSGNFDELSSLVDTLSEGDDVIDPSHIREGVVIRIDFNGEPYFLKHKSFSFKVLEGLVKETDSYVDIEEIS